MARKVTEEEGFPGLGYADDTCTLYIDVCKWRGSVRRTLNTDDRIDGITAAVRQWAKHFPGRPVRYYIIRGV